MSAADIAPLRSRLGYELSITGYLSVVEVSPSHLAVKAELMSMFPVELVRVIFTVPRMCSESSDSKRMVPLDFLLFRVHSTWISCMLALEVTSVLVQALSLFPQVSGVSSFCFFRQN